MRHESEGPSVPPSPRIVFELGNICVRQFADSRNPLRNLCHDTLAQSIVHPSRIDRHCKAWAERIQRLDGSAESGACYVRQPGAPLAIVRP